MEKSGKVKLVIITIILFSILSFAVIRYILFDKSKSSGILKIISSPISSIFINGKPIDRPTPYESKFKPGVYEIKLIARGEATSSASWQGKVTIFSNTLTYINRELGSSNKTSSGEILYPEKLKKRLLNSRAGEIYIVSDPIGAIIKLDNDEKGVSPLLISEVSAGTHELAITLPGYFPKVKKINIERGYKLNALFKLSIDQSQKIEDIIASDEAEIEQAEESISEIEILETEVGFLRVREDPNVISSEVGRVSPGDIFQILDEASGWIKINYEPNKEGWVLKSYTKEVN